ncbi:MAG: AAA family ATPase, partial [Thermoanaerobaculia bacterium]|nr:AAA family ATPase [Thermoanaerobaculia bacterium]
MTSQPVSESPEFGERFEVLRRLGKGGMGVVYLARDRVKDMDVALKTINNLSPSMLYRFKREFRSLVDLRHRNLVAVYELLSRNETWFFTMEYLEGRNFLQHLRQSRGWFDESSLHADDDTIDLAELDAAERERLLSGTSAPAEPPPARRFRLGEARPVLLQLVQGLQVLHRAGHIHCDIKPSNVMVTPEDRVVILDFGLVNPVAADILDRKTRVGLEGTYEYMAPERAVGGEASPAIDWYAVGVMLFQLLTGGLPPRNFDSSSRELQLEPPSPALFPPESPGDLVALCIDLLNVEPKRRPSGDEIRRRLGDLESADVPEAAGAPKPESVPFVGREAHQRRLDEAFLKMQQGGCRAVWVHGSSGMGKSALVHRFLRRVARDRGAVVLAGRCHEQESVPYKALDALIDALSSFLKALPRNEAGALMPRDVHTLARVFPVLERVPAVTETPGRRFESPNRREVRRRAFGALRELLARLGDRSPVVLFIDDLQWGDVDSAAFLFDLLKATDPPRLLLLGCYRSEYVESSPALQAVLDDRAAAGANQEFVEIGPLSEAQSAELARALLEPGERADEMAELVARESDGNPFFVQELALYGRALQRDGLDLRPAKVSLENLIWQRVESLPREAFLLLQAVTVSGRPLRQEDAFRASGSSGHDERALSILRAEHLVRTGGTALGDEVDTYHDRIRETIVAHLSADVLERQHRRLADALEEGGRADT